MEKKSWQWATLILLSVIWGSSFILMKRGLESYNNFQVAAFRIFLSFLFLLPMIISRLRRLGRKNLKSLLIVGFIGNFFPAFLFTTAQTHINSSLAGILNSCTPLFTLVVGMLVYRNRFLLINVIGLLLGFIGATGLIYNGGISLSGGDTGYALLILLATFFYAISVNEIRNHLHHMDGITITSLAFLFIGPVAGIYLLFSDFSQALASPGHVRNFIYIALLAFFGSFIATILFNELVRKTTAIFGASVTYLIPVFAISWGILDGESFTLDQALWALVILAGIYLVTKKKLVRL